MALLPVPSAASADHRYLAYVVNGEDRSVAVIDTHERAVADKIRTLGWPGDIAITPDGRRAYALCWREIDVIDLVTLTIVATIPLWGEDPPSRRIVMSPTGMFAYVLGSNEFPHSLLIVNTSTDSVAGSFRVPLQGPDDEVLDVVFSADGTTAYVGAEVENESNGDTGMVFFVDTTSRAVAGVVSLTHAADKLAISVDGRWLYATGHGGLSAVNLTQQVVAATVPLDGFVGGLAVNPVRSSAYVMSYTYDTESGSTSSVSAVDLGSGRVTRSRVLAAPGRGVAVLPDGSAVYVILESPVNEVVILDSITLETIDAVPVGYEPRTVLIAPDPGPPPMPSVTPRPPPSPRPDGRYQAYVASRTETLSVLEMNRAGAASTIPLGGLGVRDVAVTADGTVAYVASWASILVVEIATGEVIRVIPLPYTYPDTPPQLHRIALAPDGTVACVGTSAGYVGFIDLARGEFLGYVPDRAVDGNLLSTAIRKYDDVLSVGIPRVPCYRLRQRWRRCGCPERAHSMSN
ncbi:MAG: hypothetical protein HY699_09365 [Deltaproteobacteria bacterium]|nr:hypothetical protein [Deltaproteobacteria bacterium]